MIDYIEENNRIYKIVTGKKNSKEKTCIGRELKIFLEWDEENQEIIATYQNYLGEVQAYNGKIIFVVGDQSVEYEAFSGIAKCPISGPAGTYLVETGNDGVDNGRKEVSLNG